MSSILEKLRPKNQTEEESNKVNSNLKEEVTDVSDTQVESKETEKEEKNISEEVIKEPERRHVAVVCKTGADHSFANKNNHDYAFNLLNMKVVTDGCGSGKHSEVGTRLFAQLFARKAKEYYQKGETICEKNFVETIDSIFCKMLKICNDSKFIFENYCFTILVCFELEDEFVVYSCGDGYIIKQDNEEISFDELDDGEYPCYYVYNFITDKSCLKEYKDGVEFKITRFSKQEYSNIGVATDGLRFAENLGTVEKNKLNTYLQEGKGKMIEVLINRNNKYRMFHDDISICF